MTGKGEREGREGRKGGKGTEEKGIVPTLRAESAARPIVCCAIFHSRNVVPSIL